VQTTLCYLDNNPSVMSVFCSTSTSGSTSGSTPGSTPGPTRRALAADFCPPSPPNW
jgi:hypothetical protein